ncbi:MAG TPA: NUDIX domain-containing protein [Rhodospirillaceae bacterium]|nr:NUDIX domain-containing protein [Rhodospirillaceae bacterium]
MTKYELLTARPVGKMDAHQTGIPPLGVSVFIFCGDELLIQRRAASKYHSALQWSNTCCTYPNIGEDEQSAADRRVVEELGFSVSLQPANLIAYSTQAANGLAEQGRVRIFKGFADKESLWLDFDPEEIDAVRWAKPEALRNEIYRRPQDFTPWFRVYIERWAELGL